MPTSKAASAHRIDPFNGHLDAFHSGIDLAGPAGSAIYSTAAGTIISAGRNGAYGNCIDIDHGAGIVTRYGHLSARFWSKKARSSPRAMSSASREAPGAPPGRTCITKCVINDLQPMNPKNFLEYGRLCSGRINHRPGYQTCRLVNPRQEKIRFRLIITKDMNILGNIVSDGNIDFNGTIQGNIRCNTLTIRPARPGQRRHHRK